MGLVVVFQELKSTLIGAVLVCGVMLAGPLTTQASPADPFAALSAKAADAAAKPKPRVWVSERNAAALNGPKIKQQPLDLAATAPADFGDWENETLR